MAMKVQLKQHEDTHASQETMHLKVLVLGDEAEPGNVRFEITSMDDIFFHYVANVNEDGFNTIREEQQLSIEFTEFMVIINKLLEQIKKQEIIATLVLDNYRETATLAFQEDSEFKVIDLLCLNFQESNVDDIKNAISFRINA